MKKVYLLGGMFLVGAVSFGQQTSKGYDFKGAKLYERQSLPTSSAQVQHVTPSNQDRSLNILWTEDFSGSTALTTGNGTWTTGAAQGSYWVMSSATTHIFGSLPFALNGRHLRWNSYTPTGTEGGGFATTVVNGHITTPSIDLSGQTNGAIVEFDVQSMYCCNYQEKPWYMYVSEDDGATWSPAITIDFGVDRNVATEDVSAPMTYAVDITPYISSTPGTVMLRFSWEATAADPNGQINTHYYWMIDNMVIYETPQFEVQNQKMWLEDIQTWFEYGDIPTTQAPTLTVQNMVKSIGSDSPTSFGLEVTVYDPSMTQIHQSTGGTLHNAPLTLGEIDTITFATTFDMSTLSPGTYTVRTVTTYTETDEVTSNDTLMRTFEITDNLMSHFNYEAPTSEDYPGGTAQDPYQIGASFALYQDAVLHGVDFYISDGSTTTPTTDDAEVEFYVYEWDGSAYSYLDGPFLYTITPGMQNQYNTFNFHQEEGGSSYSPITLTAGNEYVVTMSVLAGTVVWYGINNYDDDNSGRLYFDDTWYLSSGDPMISLNFDESLSLVENEATNFTVGQNMPNPFNNTSVISYSLKETANVSVTFTDVTGKVVKTIAPGTQEAGSYSITVDAADMAEGVYFYTFTIGDNKVTKQMIVSKK